MHHPGFESKHCVFYRDEDASHYGEGGRQLHAFLSAVSFFFGWTAGTGKSFSTEVTGCIPAFAGEITHAHVWRPKPSPPKLQFGHKGGGEGTQHVLGLFCFPCMLSCSKVFLRFFEGRRHLSLGTGMTSNGSSRHLVPG